jgi:hypothetical protein
VEHQITHEVREATFDYRLRFLVSALARRKNTEKCKIDAKQMMIVAMA